MAKQVNYEMQEKARSFAEKFPIGSVLDIDAFDMFIIDRDLAKDPQTDDTKSQQYKGFVQERAAAKRALNTAASTMNGEAFRIVVSSPGKEYAVTAWSEDAKTFASQMGNRIHKFSDGRFRAMKALHNKAEQMRLESPDDDELAETHAMLGYMRQQGVELVSRVNGLVAQYNTAANTVEAEIRKLLEDKSEK